MQNWLCDGSVLAAPGKGYMENGAPCGLATSNKFIDNAMGVLAAPGKAYMPSGAKWHEIVANCNPKLTRVTRRACLFKNRAATESMIARAVQSNLGLN